MGSSAFDSYMNARAGYPGIPIHRAAITFRDRTDSPYPKTHISDDKVVTRCGRMVPPVVWQAGDRGELPYINTHAVDCQKCLAEAGIGAWH